MENKQKNFHKMGNSWGRTKYSFDAFYYVQKCIHKHTYTHSYMYKIYIYIFILPLCILDFMDKQSKLLREHTLCTYICTTYV